MDIDRLIDASKDELDLVLSFFARVESKSSVLLAITTGMLGFLTTNAPPFHEFSIIMTISASLTVLLLGASIVMLYRGAFPQLNGGHNSLVYFREIAIRTEHAFIEEFKSQTPQQHANDLLGQVWRNAEILKAKFDCLKWAFKFMAIGIIPWLITIALFSSSVLHKKP